MKTLYLLAIIYIALILPGCNTTGSPETTADPGTTDIAPPRCHHHDPVAVNFINKEKPNQPYQVVGLATVSKFNKVGVKRQEATMRDIMRQLAASLNGDAVINIKSNDKAVTGTIIAYKQVLV